MFCVRCGSPVHPGAIVCKECGSPAGESASAGPGAAPEARPVAAIPMKNPGIAAVLSFFFVGLGQIYNGEIGKAVVFMIAGIVSLLLLLLLIGFITTPILWIIGIVDAYRSAERINRSLLARA